MLAWSITHFGREDVLMVIEAAWREPLGAISPESLRAEGHDSLRDFRLAWKRRAPTGRWNPLEEIIVYRVRPWQPGDEAWVGEKLLRELYLEPLEREYQEV